MAQTTKKQWSEIWDARRRADPLLDFLMCLKTIFNAPSLGIVTGEWKSGKTDFALLLAELMLKIKLVSKIGANIMCSHPTIKIDYIADVETLRFWLHKDNTRKLYIFDEAIKHAYKRSPMARKQVNLIKLITEISKGHARGILVAQDPTMVDKDLANPVFTRALFVKGGFKNRKQVEVHSYLIDGGYRKFIGIPRTSIKFDPYQEAEFEEKGVSPLMREPDIKIFHRYMNGESMYRISIDTKLHPTSVKDAIKRVGRVFLKLFNEKADVVSKALEKEKKLP